MLAKVEYGGVQKYIKIPQIDENFDFQKFLQDIAITLDESDSSVLLDPSPASPASTPDFLAQSPASSISSDSTNILPTTKNRKRAMKDLDRDEARQIEQDFSMMFGDHVSGRFLARWSSDFKHRVITECQSLPSSPYVDELLAASNLEVENDYSSLQFSGSSSLNRTMLFLIVSVINLVISFDFLSEDENATLPDKAGPGETGTVSSLQGSPSPRTSTPVVKKILQLPSPPEYVIYTDTELARKHHFEMACTGREGESAMSKELRCRLVRNTVTSMISILRASHQGEELRYPSKHEVTAMAKRLVEYYPMLQDKDEPIKHVCDDNFSH
ncbi:hypothetical protein GBF38_022328, partial [Nibea albiflora]